MSTLESSNSSRSRSRSSSRSSRRRRPREQQQVQREVDKENQEAISSNKSSQQQQAKQILPAVDNNKEEVVTAFRTAAQKTTQASFWTKQQALSECVVHASLRLNQNKTPSSSSSLLLQERAGEILTSCRALVKEAATQIKQEKEQTTTTAASSLQLVVQENLHVALHGLRAIICTTLISDKQRDTVLRLLYHVTVTASEIVSTAPSVVVLPAILSLAALESLGTALEGCATSADSNIVLKYNNSNNSAVRFPVPQQSKTSSSSKNKRWRSSIPENQLLDMGIFSILAAARVIVSLLGRGDSGSTAVAQSNEFGLGVFRCETLNQQTSGLRHVLNCLALEIAVPWMVMIHQASSKADPKATISHCKKMQRILWEAADACRDDARERLLLQGDSIRVSLLNDCETMDDGLRNLLMASQFEAACTYAWKAAETYHRNNSSSNNIDSALRTFHENVGSVLDSFAPRDAPIVYTEYCAYRALHTGSRELPKDDSSLISDKPTADQATLALFLLTLQVRDSLVGESVCFGSDVLISGRAKVTIENFCSLIASAPAGSRLRFYRLFSMIKLHRIVFDFLGDVSVGSPATQQKNAELLELASRILWECLGPLCVGLIADKRLEESQWIVGLEIFKQAVSASEVVGANDGAAISSSDRVIETFTKTLTKSSPHPAPSECIENAAKFLNAIGKKRLERAESPNAMLPLLHSVQLLIHVAPLLSVESLRALRISNRLAFLSTAYSSLDMNDESILMTGLALLYDVAESSLSTAYSDSDDPLLNMLEHLVGLTHDVIGSASTQNDQSSNQRNALVTALVRHLTQRERSLFEPASSTKQLALPPERAVDLLLQTLYDGDPTVAESFEQRCGVAFNLCGILQVMFTKNSIPRLREIDQTQLQAKKSCLFATILAKLGLVFQRRDRSTIEKKAASFVDYSRVGLLAESYIQKIEVQSDMARRVATAAVLIVASVSLICYLTPLEYDSWDGESNDDDSNERLQMYITMAEKYAAKATTALGSESDVATDWDLAEASIRAALDLYQCQLSSLRNQQDRTINIDMEALAYVVEGVTEAVSSSCRLGKVLQQSLVRSLVRLRGHFCRDGEELQALQVSRWNADTIQGDDTDPKSWFEAAVLSLMVKDTVVPVKPADDLEATAIASQAAEMESEACRLRLFAKCTKDVARLGLAIDRLADLFAATEESISGPAVTAAALLFRWLRTTILMGLSECEEKKGDLDAALYTLRDCYKECRKLMLLLGSCRKTKATEFPYWSRTALGSLPGRCSERKLECLEKTARLYCLLGDRRKALDYADLVTEAAQYGSGRLLGAKSTFTDLIQSSRSRPAQTCLEVRSRRLLLRLKAQASPRELVLQAFDGRKSDGLLLSTVQFRRSTHQSANRELEAITDLVETFDIINGFQALSTVRDEWDLVRSVRERYYLHVSSPTVSKLIDTITPRQILPQVEYDIMLRDAMIALADNPSEGSCSQKEAIEKLNAIVSATSCSSLCQAWSYFLLGSVALRNARRNEELFDLWELRSLRGRTEESIAEARQFFGEALQLLGSSCSILKRSVQRCLALVSGPGTPENAGGIVPCLLINGSVGAATRKSVLRSLLGSIDAERFDKQTITNIYDGIDMHSFDNNAAESGETFLDELGQRVPPEWRFVTAALCPTGELLLTSIEFAQCERDVIQRSACVFPDSETRRCMYDEILKPLDEIVEQSQHQLSEEVDDSSANDRVEKEKCKRKWWGKRKELDADLEDLLNTVQERILASADAQHVLLGDTSGSIQMSCGNLASKFEAASADLSREIDAQSDPSDMKVVELRNELVEYGYEPADLRKMKKAELIDLVVVAREHETNTRSQQWEATDLQNSCTFLILDEHLQRFPFEGLPCFKGKTICRLPSLPFALAKLIELENAGETSASFDPRQTSFVLDPESNLGGTRDRLFPFIESLNCRHGGQWQSVISEVPPADFFESSLSEDRGLLLYFGHGGGQKFVSRRKIDEMVLPENPTSSSRTVNTSVILMGCSSGRLESVNMRNSTSLAQVPLYYEPEGIALSYLMAGAPCVVGNLWDVTDRDIDRFSLSVLEKIFESDADDDNSMSIAQAVAESRSACKMRCIVGFAPVCYGLPVFKQVSGEL